LRRIKPQFRLSWILILTATFCVILANYTAKLRARQAASERLSSRGVVIARSPILPSWITRSQDGAYSQRPILAKLRISVSSNGDLKFDKQTWPLSEAKQELTALRAEIAEAAVDKIEVVFFAEAGSS